MSDYMETIKKSIRQTEDCQAMANQVIKMCYTLMGYTKLLKKENDELKKEISQKGENDGPENKEDQD